MHPDFEISKLPYYFIGLILFYAKVVEKALFCLRCFFLSKDRNYAKLPEKSRNL